jgi:predicted metal-dependent HD superfamily phosphohydrolase
MADYTSVVADRIAELAEDYINSTQAQTRVDRIKAIELALKHTQVEYQHLIHSILVDIAVEISNK